MIKKKSFWIIAAAVLAILLVPDFAGTAVFIILFELHENEKPLFLYLFPVLAGAVVHFFRSGDADLFVNLLVYENYITAVLFGAGFMVFQRYGRKSFTDYLIMYLIIILPIGILINHLSYGLSGQDYLTFMKKILEQVSAGTDLPAVSYLDGAFVDEKRHLFSMLLAEFSLLIKAMMFAVVSLIVLRPIERLRPVGKRMIVFQNFSYFSLPMPVTWGFLLSWAALLLHFLYVELPVFAVMLFSAFLIFCAFLYIVEGFGVLHYYYNRLKKRESKAHIYFLVIFFVMTVFLFVVSISMIFGIGLLDQWFDYRGSFFKKEK